jgi:hypothetical protein
MIPKSGYRFSEEIMRQQKTTKRRRTWYACIVLRRRNEGGSPEHDPEKACPALDAGWVPVFGKDHAPARK